ncbi:MAG TPA: YajG family lipoprotein [Burkholderiales bacterium]|nr:YajG family lipoprotein [Burkholderiales bacterium]
MKIKILLATAAVALSTSMQGCSLTPQNLRIDPEVKVKQTQVGNGQAVGLRVSDARPDKKLGEVGDPDRKMVDVSIEEDPGPAIYERVKQALTTLGFSVQPYGETTDHTLDITIRNLQLQSLKTPLTFETELRAEVSAHAANPTAFYDRQFNVKTRKEGAAPPYEKDSTQLVNTAVSQALEDLLADDELLALLAR